MNVKKIGINVLLRTEQHIRAALLSHSLDECDLKRSHLSHAIGAWAMQNRDVAFPAVIRRFLASDASRAQLETDIQTELDAAQPRLRAALTAARRRGNAADTTRCQADLDRAMSAPKQVYSAMLNVPQDDAFGLVPLVATWRPDAWQSPR